MSGHDNPKAGTLVNHPPEVPVPADNHPLTAPIYQSVKFEFESIEETLRSFRGERPGFFYLRDSNPTNRQLELTLAALQGREDCIVCGSGVAATHGALQALTSQGDHVVCFLEGYSPTRQFLRRVLARFGVQCTLLSIDDVDGLATTLAAMPTRLVIFESPTNPIGKVPDLAALCALAKRHGVLTLLDNTLAGPHQHGQYDIDLYLHSLTKFVAGHGDVMGGAVIGRAELIRQMRPEFTLAGSVLDPHAAFLIQRGLKSYMVRYRAASGSALRVAEFLAAHPAVSRVHYPGLSTHPQHAVAREQMSDFGAIVSFDLRGEGEAGRVFTESLRLFALAASLGSTESLIMPPQMIGPRDLDAAQRQLAGIGPGTVRLSIGLEDIDDLLADLAQALEQADGGFAP